MKLHHGSSRGMICELRISHQNQRDIRTSSDITCYRKFLRALETMDNLLFEIFERTTFKIKYTQNFKKFIYLDSVKINYNNF